MREELAGVQHHWQRRRSGHEPEVVATARAAAAAGTALEYLRLTLFDVKSTGR